MRIFILALTFAAALFSGAFAQNRVVQIINDTNVTMTNFYATNRDQNSWGRDWFGSQVLPSGNAVNLNFDDGSGYCIYDFRALFSDGDEVTRFGFNVCELGSWRVY
tara:strand:+ start:1337 stop:1654 length:318 start_codon:yes stop_codon:yes gene_type:complete